MRILLITPILDPYHLWAGSHRVVYEIAKFLVRRGHSVVILTSDMMNIRSKIKQTVGTANPHQCGEIIRSRTLNSKLTELTGMTMSIDTIDFLKRELHNFDVVHAHEYTTFENIVLHHYATKYRIPYVLQAHGSIPRLDKEFRKTLYDSFFGYRILKDASRTIALTKTEEQQYQSMGVSERNISIVPNGIDLSEYANLPPKGCFKKKYNISEDRRMILYLGRIHRTKGIDLLARAYAYLFNNMNSKNTVLTVVGPDDGYLAEMKSLIASLDIQNSVFFTDFISVKEKMEAFVDADVFVTPSFNGFPITFLEACATGTPIVTTTLGDNLNWIDSNVGYVTLPTPLDLAEAIYRIISDDKLQEKFSKNCLKTVRSQFTLEKIVDKLEKTYGQVIQESL